MKNKCLCGRESIRKFKIRNGKEIYLCPLCSYEITIQTALHNYSEDYIKDLFKAIENRKEIKNDNKKTNKR